MIAVQTNDRLYLINMEDSEFVNLVMQENMAGRTLDEQLIPLIRARSGISFNSNDMVRFAKSMVSEISNCFTRVGNRFDMTPVSSLDDLMFYVDENGKQYASEEAYHMEAAEIPTPVVERPAEEEAEIPAPVVEKPAEEEAEIPAPVVEKIAEEPYIGVVEGEKVHTANGVIALPASLQDDFYKSSQDSVLPAPYVPSLDNEKEVIEVSEEQKRAASQLDNIVRNFPNIASLPTEYLAGIRHYINTQLDVFKSYSEEYLAQMSPLDRSSLLTGYPVPNAFGESKDMLDSLLIFPVYTRILSKRDFSARFSPLDLVNTTMLRICPVGITENDNLKPIVHSYVQEIRITNQDVKEADEKVNAELKKQGKSKRSLSAKEKYDLYETALEEIMKYKKGSMMASRETKLVEDLGKYEEELRKSSKVYIPAIEGWNSYDVAAFDARRRIDQFPTPLLTQLQNINGKTEEEINEEYAQLPTEFEPVEEENIKVVFVDLSEEAIKAGKTLKGWQEIEFSSIPDLIIDEIVRRDDGRYLEGYYFEQESQEFYTEEAYQDRCQAVLDSELDTELENEKKDELRTIKIKRVNSTLPFDEVDDYIEVAETYLNSIQLGFVNEVEDGYVLDGYCYDIASGDLITEIELDQIRSRKRPEVASEEVEEQDTITVTSTPILNPVISTTENTPLHLIDRKYRQAIVAKIPTVFSGGVTEEKITSIPNYSEFVSLSEDDMDDKLKAALKPTEDGYTLEGYCFDYDQVKLITEEEYVQLLESSIKSVAIEESDKEPEQQEQGFQPIIGPVGSVKVSMGAPVEQSTLDKDSTTAVNGGAPAAKDPEQSDELVDYVREDGTYIDPSGMEWPQGKESYELYKLLTDEAFLSSEEEKGKAK